VEFASHKAEPRGCFDELRDAQPISRSDGPLPIVPLRMICLAFCGGALPVIAWVASRPNSKTVAIYLAGAGGVVAIVAGAVLLVAWRLRGRAVHGWLGAAWMAFGALRLADAGATSYVSNTSRATSPADPLVIAAVAGWLLWRASITREGSRAFAPMRVIATSVGAGLALLAALHVLQASSTPMSWAGDQLWVAVSGGIAGLLWIALAVGLGRAEGDQRPWIARLRPALALIGCADLVLAPAPTSMTSILLSMTLLLLAAAIAAATAVSALQVEVAAEQRRRRKLAHQLSDVQQRAARDQDRFEEWLHDVRNLVSGLQAADAVLRRNPGPQPASRTALSSAVSAEIARLQELLEPCAARASEIPLSEVVERARAIAKIAGSSMDCRVGDLRVRAEPQALTRVVHNVLENVRRYAPGSPVHVGARSHGGHVYLQIRDEGPGIPPEELATVFERGRRGSTSAGTEGKGFGLHAARRLVQEMGGDMMIAADGNPGCAVVITLPEAKRGRAVHAPRDKGWRTRSGGVLSAHKL